MADRIAMAVTQSQLYESERWARREAEEAHARLSFLARPARSSRRSLDYESTLQAVVTAGRTAPRRLVCGRHDRLGRQNGPHRGRSRCPSRSELLRRRRTAARAEHDDPVGPSSQCSAAGLSELAPHVSHELLGFSRGDDAGDDALRELGLGSYMCVRCTGVTRARDDPCSRPASLDGTQKRLALAEELARRAAVAVENALLYRQVEERARRPRVLAAAGDGVFLVDRRGSFASGTPRLRRSPASRRRRSSAATPRRRSRWAAVAPGARVGAAALRGSPVRGCALGLPGESSGSRCRASESTTARSTPPRLTRGRKTLQLSIESSDAVELAEGVLASASAPALRTSSCA